MRKPRTAPKKQPRKVCRCHGVSQRVSVITGAGGGAPAPVVHQVGVPMQAPTVPPQFMFPVSNGIGDPRFATDREKVRRDDHHYDRVGFSGRIEPTPRMPESGTSTLERVSIGTNTLNLNINKNEMVDMVLKLGLFETKSEAKRKSADELRELILQNVV